jgi:hypothetical protein
MRKVSKQIIKTPIDQSIINKLRNQFFKIIRENGIKEGEWVKNGRLTSNFEWTMCKVLFFENLQGKLELSFLFDNVPKDLMAYGEKPKGGDAL